MKRNHLINFYAMIAWPLATLVLMSKLNLISTTVFVGGLVIYAFLYHPYVSAQRLRNLGAVDSDSFWKSFIPFWNIKYFDLLFFKS